MKFVIIALLLVAACDSGPATLPAPASSRPVAAAERSPAPALSAPPIDPACATACSHLGTLGCLEGKSWTCPQQLTALHVDCGACAETETIAEAARECGGCR